MKLIRGAWKLLVGVKDLLVLLFMLLFFGSLAAALSVRPGAKPIGSGALMVDLNGSIAEQPASVSATEALSGTTRAHQYRLRDVIAALDAAVTDDRVKTVVLDLDGFMGGGQVALTDVGAALDRVRAKKPVLAFATGYTDSAYQLAAHASEIWLDPMGLALFAGPGGSQLYYKGLLDRLGVTAHVYRVGKFKSAVEPYILSAASPDAKAENVALANALWTDWQADVTRARPKAKLAAYVADPVAAASATHDLAKAALAAGIVDHIGDETAFGHRVAEIAGNGRRDEPFAGIDFAAYSAAHQPSSGDGKIGIVTVAGVITDGEADAGTAGGDTIVGIIRRALATDKYKALVLRVDSPGGSALASEKIRSALMEAHARGLPIVVSMSNVAASGGYWVATSGDRVFAEPATITGSIGIFGVIPTFEGALKKIGVTTDGVRTTPLSGQPDVVGGTSPAFDAVVQTGIEAGYAHFIALVSAARQLPPERVNEIGQGRVWDGAAARQVGLVDAFGTLDDAIADAARRAKLDPSAAHAVWLDKEPNWREALGAMFADASKKTSTDLLSTMAHQRVDALAGAVDDVRLMMSSSAVQARCLDCPSPVAPAAPVTLFQMVRSWL